jgi:hypothetical protein
MNKYNYYLGTQCENINWNRDNKLEAKKLGSKVFYLRSDVMDKLNKLR